MSDVNDKLGRPILEDGTDPFYLKHTIGSNYTSSLYPRIRADRTANFVQSMLMVDLLLQKYEATYEPNEKDPTLLCLPFKFKEPDQGVQVRNLQTKEVYTIIDTPKNPVTGLWEGLIRIEAITPPNKNLAEKLEFIGDSSLVRFVADAPEDLGINSQTSDEMHKDVGPIAPTIVYSLVRKEPGSIGAQPFGRQKQYKPRFMERLRPQRSSSGHTIEVYAHRFDLLVEFSCYTTDNRSADLLADWFEDFMRQYTWVLKLNGVQEILYWQRLRDETVTKWRQDLKSRSVQYFFRIEEILPELVKDIAKIDATIDLEAEIEAAGQAWVAGQLVTGQISPNQYRQYFVDDSGKFLFGDLTLNDGNLS